MEDYKKKYEEALDRARTFNQRWQGIEVTDSELTFKELKEIFPELKESEDERIIKAIIEFVKQNKSFTHCKGVSKDDCLTWLEKQGEQKSTWSEDDFSILDSIICVVEEWEDSQSEEEKKYYGASTKSDWLKSLKERMKGE